MSFWIVFLNNFLIFALVHYLKKTALKNAPLHKNGMKILVYSRLWFVMVALCCITLCVFILLCLIKPTFVPIGQTTLFFLLFSGLLVGCCFILFWLMTYAVLYDDSGIETKSCFGSKKVIWQDISKIENNGLGEILIKTCSNDCLRVSIYTNGIRYFVNELDDFANPYAWKSQVQAIKKELEDKPKK
jgi:hypothetical protein